MKWAVASAVIGIVSLILLSVAITPHLGVLASAFLFAIASIAAGALIGFLFGVPRSVSSDGGEESAPGSLISHIRANTNLEQVSDWLTKILIGATLVQLGKIPSTASRLFGAMAPALGDTSSSAAFAGGIVIYFGVLGFLTGWLATRLYLGEAMRNADVTAKVAAATVAKKAGKNELANELMASAQVGATGPTGPTGPIWPPPTDPTDGGSTGSTGPRAP
jgi:hypothetical protein